MAKSSERLILVTGATGQQGGAVLRHLRDRGFPVRALTRDPNKPAARSLVGQGTEVVQGDLEDPPSLTRALDGVYGVYSVQSSAEEGLEAEIRQGVNLADAVKRSRATHLVYSSVAAADQKTGLAHFESKLRIENHIRNTGLRYTILRPVFFMENWLRMKNVIEQGTLAYPLNPDTRLQMIAVDDIGAMVTSAFERPGRWQGRTLDIAGDELSMKQLVQAFAHFTGGNVEYVEVPWEQFEQQAGREISQMFRWFQDVGFHIDLSAIRQEYANLTTFERWLQTGWRTAPSVMTQRG